MKNKFYRLKLINSQKKDENNISNKPRSKGSFSSFKSYQTEPKNIPIAKSLNSSNPKKKGNGNYNMMKGELSSIRTSLAYLSKNMRTLNQQNEVFINAIKSEKDKTTTTINSMKKVQNATTTTLKEMKTEQEKTREEIIGMKTEIIGMKKEQEKTREEIIGMKKEQQETNKLLKELISTIKEEKKVSIHANEDNQDQKDNKIQFINEQNNEFRNNQRYMDIFSSQSDIKSDNNRNISNVINDMVSSDERERKQIKKEEKKEKDKIQLNQFKNSNIKKYSFKNSAKKK
jgi:hypothetical protein